MVEGRGLVRAVGLRLLVWVASGMAVEACDFRHGAWRSARMVLAVGKRHKLAKMRVDSSTLAWIVSSSNVM